MKHPRLFRSYEVAAGQEDNAEIWEVARATTAAPLFFKSIFIGTDLKEEFIDGTWRFNNPTDVVCTEAESFYVAKCRISCILNIGTGHPKVIKLPESHKFQDSIPEAVAKKLVEIAEDCENTADKYESKYGEGESRVLARGKKTYFRLNVQHGLQDVSLLEWTKLAEVKTHTRQYMQDAPVKAKANQIRDVLEGKRRAQEEIGSRQEEEKGRRGEGGSGASVDLSC
ncbi:hypothetical protein C0992_007123 [Termitomyces sp. T32_za158]|nr:hypothetical protein C0992_007123 [Termitomyces sp. T32_za158]